MVQKSWQLNILSIVLIIAGFMLMATSFVLTTRTSSQSGMWMGTSGTMTGYTATNILIGIIGAFMTTSGLMYILLRQEYEPLPSSSMPLVISTSSHPLVAEQRKMTSESDAQTIPQVEAGMNATSTPEHIVASTSSVALVPDDGHKSTYYLALRLLSGDERAMFKALMDSGGEALQKDLIPKTRMSDAKVSRVIDRLEEKGVVSKIRFGMTNKVRIEIET